MKNLQTTHRALFMALFTILSTGGLLGQPEFSDSLYIEIQGDIVTLHHNQTYRNCGSEFDMQVDMENFQITVTEVDLGQPAFCECYFDLSVTFGPLIPGNYALNIFGTDDYYGEFWGNLEFEIEGNMLLDQSTSDCLTAREDSTWIDIAVEENMLTFFYNSALLNCCQEAVWNGMLQGEVFHINLSDVGAPCDCECIFDLTADFGPFTPGTYTVYFLNGLYGSPQFSIGNGLPQNWEVTEQYQSNCYQPSELFGCTDSVANNYDPEALYNDGSCEYDCSSPNPAGCFQTGCPYGYECLPEGCEASWCSCDAEYDYWICTEDCGGGMCVPLEDCAGVPGGSAELDTCGICCGGTTGVECSWYNWPWDFGGAYDCAGDCFGQEVLVDCFVDPCEVETCPLYPDAECIADYCGGCFAHFFVDDVEVDCDQPMEDCAGVPGGSAELDTCGVCCSGTTGVECSFYNSSWSYGGAYDCAGDCFGDEVIVDCFIDPCEIETCPLFPDAECIPDYCGGCFAHFFVNGVEVDCDYSPFEDCTTAEDCGDNFICVPSDLECNTEDEPGMCIDLDEVYGCFDLWEPVCGCDGITYSNDCYANLFGYTGVAYFGECEAEDYCWYNDMCDADEYCYFEICLAETGICADRPENCQDIYDPVCGCDGVTYSNACHAAQAGMSVDYEGPCDGEVYNGPVWYVSPEGSDITGDGSEGDPFSSIQTGINAASDSHTVLVAPGSYTETLNYYGKNITVASFALTTGDSSYIEETIITAMFQGPVVTFENGESQEAVLHGFTISDGFVEGDLEGAGIRIIGASPTISNNIIRENIAVDLYHIGGGIYCENGSPLIQKNTISNHLGYYYGSGICVVGESNPQIENNVLFENTTASGWGIAYGAGIYIGGPGGSAIISGNTLFNNEVDVGFGAAIALKDSASALIDHNIIYDNTNGGIAVSSAFGSLVNNTIVGNSPNGLFVENASSVEVYNSILWNNTNSQILVNDDFDLSNLAVNYSDVQDGWDGEGNINQDPLFAAPDDNNYHLTEDSPCIDAGDWDSDLDPDGTRADLGALYYHQDCIYQWGDINGDGNHDILDVVEMLNLILEVNGPPTLEQICAVDLDGDGVMSIDDFDCFLIPEESHPGPNTRDNSVSILPNGTTFSSLDDSIQLDITVVLGDVARSAGIQFDLVFENWESIELIEISSPYLDNIPWIQADAVIGNRLRLIGFSLIGLMLPRPAEETLYTITLSNPGYTSGTVITTTDIYSQPFCSGPNTNSGSEAYITLLDEPCPDLTGVDFGPCEAIIGWGWMGDDCYQLSGCGPEGNLNGEIIDYSEWLFGSYEACMENCDEDLPNEDDVCVDLTNVDFGDCEMALGIGWTEDGCTMISGCDWYDMGGNYYGYWLFDTIEECEALCSVPPAEADCPELFDGFFGPCDMTLGWTWNGEDCSFVSGCGTIGDDGQNYAQWIYNTYAQCMAICGSWDVPDFSFDFGPISLSEGTVEIWIDSEVHANNIVFSLSGISIESIDMGPDLAWVMPFWDETNEVSFFMMNGFINPGTYHLCTIHFSEMTAPEICLTDPFVTSYIGEPVTWIELPDCGTPDPVHFTDILNGYMEEYLELEGVLLEELPIVNVVIESAPDMDIGDEISLMDANGIINFGDCSDEYGQILVGAGVWMGQPLTIQAY
ncbi:MAG: right-handed parallel beta-helix repeat-containing protein, partial [FCB group bacterium]|nr:right-handed parallel beta-helix repeat-containing protein [FCB group bacterium]